MYKKVKLGLRIVIHLCLSLSTTRKVCNTEFSFSGKFLFLFKGHLLRVNVTMLKRNSKINPTLNIKNN